MSQINLQELLGYLNSYLNSHEFKDYGPNGLQIEGKSSIKKCVFSTSCSLEVIKEAIDLHADAIIVHHGLFWDKDERVLSGAILEKIKMLIEHKISLIAYHLPLDAHQVVGNNAMILKTLGIMHVEPFEGIGMQATCKLKKDDLIKRVKQEFAVHPIIPPCDKELIEKIAVVSGGGHSFLKQCKKQNIDAFITGTFDEWVWDYAQENNILFIPLGHYRSETLGVKALSELIKKQFSIESVIIDIQNPY